MFLSALEAELLALNVKVELVDAWQGPFHEWLHQRATTSRREAEAICSAIPPEKMALALCRMIEREELDVRASAASTVVDFMWVWGEDSTAHGLIEDWKIDVAVRLDACLPLSCVGLVLVEAMSAETGAGYVAGQRLADLARVLGARDWSGFQPRALLWRKEAAAALAKRLQPHLARALGSAEPLLQGSVADALTHLAKLLDGDVYDAQWTPCRLALRSMLAGEDAAAASAARALAALQDFEAAPLLAARLLTLADGYPQGAVADALVELGAPEAGPALSTVFERTTHASARRALARALIRLEVESSLPLLLRVARARLHSKDLSDEDLRKEVAQHIGKVADPRGLPLLEKLASDPRPVVRWTAAEALGRIPSAEGTAVLERLLDDPEEHVRRVSRESLGRLPRPT
jgi:HEAT repeat protein